jgi:hypothetical protein
MATKEPKTTRSAAGRPPTGRDDTSVRFERRLARMASAIAGYRGIPSAQLLADIVRGPLTVAYGQMLREIEQKGGP